MMRWCVRAFAYFSVCVLTACGSGFESNSNFNHAPVVNAGDDRSVDEGTAVSMTGQGSDADGRIVSYQWSRVSGPAVTLNDADTATVRFSAPQVAQQTLLTLRLTVTDDRQATASDDVVITIRDTGSNNNTPPVANAGADQTVTEGATVTLDGRASSDAQDGSNLGYAWTQTAGPNVMLNAANTAQPSFTAPQVSTQTTLGFRLTVTDAQQAQSSDEVQVVVNDAATSPPPPPAFDLCDPITHTYCLSQVPTLGPALLGVLQPILGGSTPAAAGLWLKGDLHVHDDHSADGSLPRQTVGQGSPGNTAVSSQIRWAETMGMDFLPLTDHRTFDQHYDPQWKSDKLLLITGEEANSSPHAIVLGAVDMINQANNPGGTPDKQAFHKLQQSIWDAHLQGAAWSTAHPDDGEVQTVNADGSITPNNNAFATGPNLAEIWNRGTLNRPKIAYCENRWNAGYRFGVAGASDDHFVELWPIAGPGTPTTRVFAREKSTPAMLEALRAGHTVINLNAAAPVATLSGDFDGDGIYEAIGGDEVHLAAEAHAKLRVNIKNGMGATVNVYRMPGIPAGAFKTFQPMQPDQNFDFEITARQSQDWYRVEVRGPGDPDGLDYNKFLDGDPAGSLEPDYANQLRAVTSPIFISTGELAKPESPDLPSDAGSADGASLLFGSASDNAFAGFANVAEASGVVHAVAEVRSNGASAIQYRRQAQGVLSAPVNLAPASRLAFFPRIAAAGDDVWVVWQDGRAGEVPHHPQIYIRHSADGGLSWQPEQQVSTSTARAEHPGIALVSPALPVVVWQDNSGGAFDIHARVIGRDAAPVNLSARGKTIHAGNAYDTRSAIYPASVNASVTVRADGLIAVGWQDNRYDRDPGWTGHMTSPQESAQRAPAAQENPEDGTQTQTDDWEILVATRAATDRWSAPVNASRSADHADRHAALAFAADGSMYAAWDSKTNDSMAGPRLAIHVSRSTDDGATWAVVTDVSQAPEFSSQRPEFGHNGNALSLFWMDGRSADWRWRVWRSDLSAESAWGAAQAVTGRGNAAWPSYSNGWLVFTSDRNATREQRKPQQVFLRQLSETQTGVAPGDTDVATPASITTTTGIVPLCRSLGPQVQPLCDGIESGTSQLIAGCVGQFGQSPAFCATLGGHLQGIVDACRENNGSLFCKAADTFLEGSASSCRQIPQAPRDFCALFSRQRIAADEITQFEKTWTHRALQLQYELGASLRFVDALFPATHNSFNAADANTPPTLSGLDSNQRYTTVDQLRMGIRAIEIDVHWMPRPDKLGFAPTVCHGNQEHVGCTLERSLEAELTDVRNWMNANPTQVILLYLENNLNQPTDAPIAMTTGTEPYAAAATVIRNTLGTLLYTPADHGAACGNGHPLKASISSLRALGKRVYIQTEGCNAGWASLVFNKEAANTHTQSPDTSQLQTFSVDGVCGGFSRADHQKKITRYFEDGTFIGAVTSQSDTHLGSPEDFRGMVRCGVNMPSMDHVTPSDPRLPAFVWSWEPGQPAVSATQNCALHTQAARFHAADCSMPRPYACARYSDIAGAPAQKSEWAMGLPAGAGSGGIGVCPAGYQFATPRNGYENELLRLAKLAANVSEVWLDYSDAAVEGAWRLGSVP